MAVRYVHVVPGNSSASFSIDRTVVSVGRLKDDDSQVGYWLSQPPERRLAALEFLRRSRDPDAYDTQRLRGFFEVVKRT